VPQQISYAVHAAPAEPPLGLFDLLCRAFDEPPYTDVPTKMAKRLTHWAAFTEVPGFRVVIAHDGEDLVGACFGWDSVVRSPGAPTLFAGLYDKLRAQPFADRLAGTEVVELAVDPARRGAGIGAGLVDRLLGNGAGWLLADRRAPAYDWYVHHGWEVVGPVDETDDYEGLIRSA
jgi:GNAT superfamily N-acetyltransferase